MANTAEQTALERIERMNRYQREYRKKHPEKARAWREAYIIRAAARIAEREAAAAAGGDDHKGGAGDV